MAKNTWFLDRLCRNNVNPNIVDSSIHIWMNPFPTLGMSGILFHFYSILNINSCKQTVYTLIRWRILWRLVLVYTVYLGPIDIMSLITRKPVRGSNQVRLKPNCSAAETSLRLAISAIARRGIILSRQQTTKVLIRLCRCAGWPAPLLFVYGINRFSHDMAHMSGIYGLT